MVAAKVLFLKGVGEAYKIIGFPNSDSILIRQEWSSNKTTE